MRVIVLGGTGNVGTHVVRGLAAKNVDVLLATRSPERVKNLPAKATPVGVDMMKPETVSKAVAGVNAVYLVTPLSETEVEEGNNILEAMKQHGVQRLVFQSIHNVQSAPHIPHFASKIELERRIAKHGFTTTIVAPNNFFQNDATLVQPMLEYGIYPQPMGSIGTSRVDVRDIADAAVNALTQSGHEGQTYPLVGPDVWSGENTAAELSRAFGKAIRYGGDDLEAWGAQVKGFMPNWLIDDLKIMYDYFQKNGLLASEADYKQQAKVLGHAPRRFQDYARELAQSLGKQTGAA